MVHTFLQGVFIATISIMVIAIVAPAFYTSTKNPDKLLSKFVVPIDDASQTSQAFAVTHIETLLQKSRIAPQNIALVAADKGVHLFEKGNKFEQRLQALREKGVQMFVCEASLKSMRQSQQAVFTLFDGVIKVANGREQIDILMDQGFTNSFA